LDLLDLAILALRLALVALLYVFLLIVLRAAGRGLQATRPTPEQSLELRLIVLDAGESGLVAGQVIELSDGATLGRSERAGIVVADSAVSAEHARVTRVGDDWIVNDLGSTNGTLVNDAAVNGQARLNHGDVLGLGGVRLKVAVRGGGR
jgi:predicted component of type VI protein secretion system